MLIGLLLSTSLAVAQEHETEDKGSLEVGDSASGELEAGVRDRYTVEAGEDDAILNVFLDGTGDMDTYLRVYREDEDEPFAENDDRGDGSLFSAVVGIEVEEGDVLIVEVSTYDDTVAGEYTVRVAPPATIEDAGEITLGEPIEATFPENTRQRYSLSVDETTALSILLEGDDDLDTYLRLYVDDEEAPAVQNNSIAADNVAAGFSGLVVPGGTELVIEAGTAADGGAGDYTLTVEEADIDLGEMAAPIELTEDTLLGDLCADAEEV